MCTRYGVRPHVLARHTRRRRRRQAIARRKEKKKSQKTKKNERENIGQAGGGAWRRQPGRGGSGARRTVAMHTAHAPVHLRDTLHKVAHLRAWRVSGALRAHFAARRAIHRRARQHTRGTHSPLVSLSVRHSVRTETDVVKLEIRPSIQRTPHPTHPHTSTFNISSNEQTT